MELPPRPYVHRRILDNVSDSLVGLRVAGARISEKIAVRKIKSASEFLLEEGRRMRDHFPEITTQETWFNLGSGVVAQLPGEGNMQHFVADRHGVISDVCQLTPGSIAVRQLKFDPRGNFNTAAYPPLPGEHPMPAHQAASVISDIGSLVRLVNDRQHLRKL